MRCNRQKLVQLRTSHALTQEALAGKAKLNVRTIQRAEAGDDIDLQTVQEIASALGVQPREIETDQKSDIDPPTERPFDETMAVILRPQKTGRALLDTLSDCLDCKLSYDIDLNTEMAETVNRFCDAIRPVLPELCPADFYESVMSRKSGNEATRLMERITTAAKLNDAITDLSKIGIGVYAGTYVDLLKVPRWDMDEMAWITSTKQREEPVKIALVQIAAVGLSQTTMRVQVTGVPF